MDRSVVGERSSAESHARFGFGNDEGSGKIRIADIVRPINNRECASNPEMLVKDFVNDIFFVVHRLKWKRSTAMTNEYRISFHICGDLGDRKIGAVEREELQSFLDRKAIKEAGLDWVNFQVMRRTHSTLMNQLKVEPKLVADQLGHTLDVNQNVYTIPDLARRHEAMNMLEGAVQNA